MTNSKIGQMANEHLYIPLPYILECDWWTDNVRTLYDRERILNSVDHPVEGAAKVKLWGILRYDVSVSAYFPPIQG